MSVAAPKLTVLTSCYDVSAFLRAAIESILAQTFTDFEFILTNDGSTDNTAEILTSYKDARLRVVHQEHKGLAKSLNHGLSVAETELVVRMDADDSALPNRLELQLEEYDWQRSAQDCHVPSTGWNGCMSGTAGGLRESCGSRSRRQDSQTVIRWTSVSGR